MDDIVKRLRLTDPEFQRTDPAVLQRRAWEAADEIEKLRRAFDRMADAVLRP